MRNFLFAAIFLLSTVLSYPIDETGNSTPVRSPHNYMLVFDMTDYSSKLGEAVNYFFAEVFRKNDRLMIITPTRLMGFSPQKLAGPKNKLISKILNIVKTDISIGGTRERSILNSMMDISANITPDDARDEQTINHTLESYLRMRKNLVSVRGSYQERLMQYARYFGNAKGENHMVVFLQRQFRPIPDARIMNILRENTTQTGFKAVEAFLGDNYRSDFDFFKINTRFQYAVLTFHFILLNEKKIKFNRGVRLMDDLGNIYNNLSKLARATGGVQLTTAEPKFFFQRLQQFLAKGNVESEVVKESIGK